MTVEQATQVFAMDQLPGNEQVFKQTGVLCLRCQAPMFFRGELVGRHFRLWQRAVRNLHSHCLQLLNDSWLLPCSSTANQAHLKAPFGGSRARKDGNEIHINWRTLFSALPAQMVQECFLDISRFAVFVIAAP